jgi:hypothetical protein
MENKAKKMSDEEIAMTSKIAMTKRVMTLGEKRCHIDFNPSSDDKIGAFKRMMADAIDFLDQERLESVLSGEEYLEQVRCFKIAMEHLETAQMYGVKGIAKGLKN